MVQAVDRTRTILTATDGDRDHECAGSRRLEFDESPLSGPNHIYIEPIREVIAVSVSQRGQHVPVASQILKQNEWLFGLTAERQYRNGR